MARHKHDLGETFGVDSPSRKTKFFPSVTISASIGEPGTKVTGNFDGQIKGVNIDEHNKTRTTVELRSMDLDSDEVRRKKATSSVAAMLRKQGHFA